MCESFPLFDLDPSRYLTCPRNADRRPQAIFHNDPHNALRTDPFPDLLDSRICLCAEPGTAPPDSEVVGISRDGSHGVYECRRPRSRFGACDRCCVLRSVGSRESHARRTRPNCVLTRSPISILDRRPAVPRGCDCRLALRWEFALSTIDSLASQKVVIASEAGAGRVHGPDGFFTDGTWVGGTLLSWSRQAEEDSNRDLTLQGPIFVRSAAARKATEIPDAGSLVISAGQIAFMTVTHRSR